MLTHIINHSQDSVNQASLREMITSGILRVCNTDLISLRAALAQTIVAMGSAGLLESNSGGGNASRGSGGRACPFRSAAVHI